MRQQVVRWALPIGVILTVLTATTVPQLAEAAGGGTAAKGPTVPRTYLSPLTPGQIAALSANQTQKVIVLMKNQYANLPGAGSQLAQREATLASDQSPIAHELASLHAPAVHDYQFVNAIAATISPAEVTRLSADPAVQAVVPDTTVQGPSVSESAASMAAATGGAQAAAATPAPAVPPVVTGTPAGVCPSNPSSPILEPEALQVMNVNFGPGSTQPAANDLATGAGVKVAVFPDGIDPTIPDFTRNGQSVIFDYQDFSGEGVNGVTGGEEAFGDVSSIASQGNSTFDLSGEVNPAANKLPPGCTIRIQGVAPGASVAVMKVFGSSNAALNSVILQGIDWAVTHDHVDILSESLGENPIPNPGADPIAIADADAVAAGITVVASTGDAGPTNTISSPANGDGVIAVGASTTYREYAQTTSYGYQFGNNGWESDNVSDVSSSGVNDTVPSTIDVLAPGESGWADCSTNTTEFTECADLFNGPAPQPIVAFGGTSEAAPLTAGVAALVIQAYRNSHGGATPAPALVKQIIMSSAQDLGVPANEQGAGLVDGLRAVQDAMSIADSNGTPAATGSGLLYSPNSISLTGQPGQSSVTPVNVTNAGTTTQTVTPTVRVLGPAHTIAQGTLQLKAATDPTMVFQNGAVVGDVHLLHFTVAPGVQRLLSQISWQTATQVTATVRETLFDPSGRIAAQSRPQGDGGGFGQVEVRDPSPGSWTMLTFDAGIQPQLNEPNSVLAPYTGPLAFTITGADYRSVPSSVSPASAVIAPGASATFAVQAAAPSAPGDLSESLVFGSDTGTPGAPSLGSVPIITRALVPLGRHSGGSFSGTLTGGNARMFFGQQLTYQFDVQPGIGNQVLSVNVQVADPGYQVLGILSDPNFSPVDAQSTLSSVSSENFQTLTLTWLDPMPGRWTLDLDQILNVSSGVTAARVRGTISLGPPPAGAAGLPDGQRLGASSTVHATVFVVNTSLEPEAYSVDPRLTTPGVIPLASLVNPTAVPLPVTDSATIPQFLVPPFTTGLEIAAQASLPIGMDTSPAFGFPDVEAVSAGNQAVATLTEPDIPTGVWSCAASELGPFAGPVTTTSFDCGAAAFTDSFDPGADSDTGNIWSALEGETVNYAPLVLAPGQSGTIGVTLTVTGTQGQRVNGFLAVETFNPNTLSSDQIAALPYSYKVGH